MIGKGALLDCCVMFASCQNDEDAVTCIARHFISVIAKIDKRSRIS